MDMDMDADNKTEESRNVGLDVENVEMDKPILIDISEDDVEVDKGKPEVVEDGKEDLKTFRLANGILSGRVGKKWRPFLSAANGISKEQRLAKQLHLHNLTAKLMKPIVIPTTAPEYLEISEDKEEVNVEKADEVENSEIEEDTFEDDDVENMGGMAMELDVDVDNPGSKVDNHHKNESKVQLPIKKKSRKRKRRILLNLKKKKLQYQKIRIPYLTQSDKRLVRAGNCFLLRNCRQGRIAARKIISGKIVRNWNPSFCAKTCFTANRKLAKKLRLENLTFALELTNPIRKISGEERNVIVSRKVFLFRNLSDSHRLIRPRKTKPPQGKSAMAKIPLKLFDPKQDKISTFFPVPLSPGHKNFSFGSGCSYPTMF